MPTSPGAPAFGATPYPSEPGVEKIEPRQPLASRPANGNAPAPANA